MSRGVFIISLDCEGKWGMADHISEHHTRYFTNANITIAYDRLLSILSKWNIKATFAFVSLFTMSYDEYHEYRNLLGDSAVFKAWLKYFHRDIKNRSYDGWFVPGLQERVVAEGLHEIASHGFCHIPFDEETITHEEAIRELRAVALVNKTRSVELRTFIYPRNIIGYKNVLSEMGYVGYRDALTSKQGPFVKVNNILREFNLAQKCQIHPNSKPLITIPSGYFLNWRNGLRSVVPIAITIKRWKNIIDDAIKNNGVAHLWLHPHNLIDGKFQAEMLDEILRYVSIKLNSGALINHTQYDYCSSATTDR